MDFKENVSDFFKEIKERVSSPFFSSFVIAWLIINWRVPVALIFTTHEVIKAGEDNYYIQLINDKVDFMSGFAWPLLSSFVYCFGYPWLRNKIEEAQAYYRKVGGNRVLEISEGSNVPIQRLIEQRKKYIERSKELEDAIKREAEILQENVDLKKQVTDYATKTGNLEGELGKWKINENAILGRWFVTEVTAEGNQLNRGLIYEFSMGRCTFYEGRTAVYHYRIESFTYNPERKQINFLLTPTYENANAPLMQFHLISTEGHEILTGYENGKQIIFKKSAQSSFIAI